MSLFKRGKFWWYEFWFASRRIRESTKTGSKTVAKAAEQQRRRELEEGFNDLEDVGQQRVRSIREISGEYLASCPNSGGGQSTESNSRSNTEQFGPRTDLIREAGLQLLDTLERLETGERKFQLRTRSTAQSATVGIRDRNGRRTEVLS
jgi:hypothetical protein